MVEKRNLVERLRGRENLTAAIGVLIFLTDVLGAYDTNDQSPEDRIIARALRSRAESLRADLEKFLQSKGTGKVRAP